MVKEDNQMELNGKKEKRQTPMILEKRRHDKKMYEWGNEMTEIEGKG